MGPLAATTGRTPHTHLVKQLAHARCVRLDAAGGDAVVLEGKGVAEDSGVHVTYACAVHTQARGVAGCGHHAWFPQAYACARSGVRFIGWPPRATGTPSAGRHMQRTCHKPLPRSQAGLHARCQLGHRQPARLWRAPVNRQLLARGTARRQELPQELCVCGGAGVARVCVCVCVWWRAWAGSGAGHRCRPRSTRHTTAHNLSTTTKPPSQLSPSHLVDGVAVLVCRLRLWLCLLLHRCLLRLLLLLLLGRQRMRDLRAPL
jgi:hypothetical protein